MREYELESAFNEISRRMSLRRPQRTALRKFHEAVKRLPQKLSEMDPAEAYGYFRESFPEFPPNGRLELTCALATGVGKTRLIGAFIAYLYLSSEASRFLILAPRKTIIDKVIRELAPGHPKYIFVDEMLVGEPEIIHAGNLQTFNPSQQKLTSGPEIWVFSSQSIAGSGSLKFKTATEFLGGTPVEYLTRDRCLITFFDESHYLGDDTVGRGAWMKELRALNPNLLIETTGSPRAGVNILHEYDIKEALQEGIYIKDVELFSKKRPASVQDDEWDRITLRDALKRLRIKEDALRRRHEDTGIAEVKPVLLVCAESKQHADAIVPWIQDQLEPGEKAISVHSGLNEDQYVEELLEIEENDVKVVVHVFKLTEGWDVPNVYVIATLRAMATVRGVTQTMGRGLRLPFGGRIGDQEADSLDLLCYGSETSQTIVDELIKNGFGSSIPGRPLIKVRDDPEESRSRELTRLITYPPLSVCKLNLHSAALKLNKPNLDALDLPAGQPERMRSIGLRSLQIRVHDTEGAGIEKERFRSIVVEGALKNCRNLGGLTDRGRLEILIDRMLEQAGLKDNGFVPIDTDMAIRQISDLIKTEARRVEPEYIISDTEAAFVVGDIVCRVPQSFSHALHVSSLTPATWNRSEHAGIPIAGWNKCPHEAVPFDSAGELAAAKALDRSVEVDWWARNLPNSFCLSTPAGNYYPDFLLVWKLENGYNVLLEIKGEFLAVGEQSEAKLKAKAAQTWCAAMTTNGIPWQYWLVLDREAQRCQTVEDLKRASEP